MQETQGGKESAAVESEVGPGVRNDLRVGWVVYGFETDDLGLELVVALVDVPHELEVLKRRDLLGSGKSEIFGEGS